MSSLDPATEQADPAETAADAAPYPSKAPPSSRFRFKDEKRRDEDGENSSSRSHRRRHHHHRHRRRRSASARPQARSRSPGPGPRELSPDTAFRESLFDAMADDEGAAYWEGVYGQPIHIYGDPPQAGATYEGAEYNDPGVLDAEEYAAYVRRKMWEKSHQHILEERARREAQAELRRKERIEEEKLRNAHAGYWSDFRQREDGGKCDGKANSFADDLEAGLRRGERRREEKRWRQRWKVYSDRWDDLLTEAHRTGVTDEEPKGAGQSLAYTELPWPVLSGEPQDVQADGVRTFFSHMPSSENGVDSLKARLKLERVRWHPDKVVQRFQVDEPSLQKATAVFQVIDQMWNEERHKL